MRATLALNGLSWNFQNYHILDIVTIWQILINFWDCSCPGLHHLTWNGPFSKFWFSGSTGKRAKTDPIKQKILSNVLHISEPYIMSVTISTCYTARLWNSLPVECFPLTYDLSGFKSRINRHLLAGCISKPPFSVMDGIDRF